MVFFLSQHEVTPSLVEEVNDGSRPLYIHTEYRTGCQGRSRLESTGGLVTSEPVLHRIIRLATGPCQRPSTGEAKLPLEPGGGSCRLGGPPMEQGTRRDCDPRLGGLRRSSSTRYGVCYLYLEYIMYS